MKKHNLYIPPPEKSKVPQQTPDPMEMLDRHTSHMEGYLSRPPLFGRYKGISKQDVIDAYAHDYRDMAMSEEKLAEMLTRFAGAIEGAN